jgi:hypothetical protein
MALVEGAGTSATTLAAAGTSRIDISEFLAANLVLANNVLGSIRVGPEFSGNFQVCTWNEDKLNANFVTDTTAGGISSSATQIIVSAADASVTPVGTILCDAGATGGLGGGEQLQVTGVTYSGSTANLQISRAYGGTTASSHAQSAVYTHIARPLQQNSDLGPDMSRARVVKYNYLQRQGIDVVLAAEAIESSRRGYTPGIQDELKYQLRNRTQELLRLWNTSVIYGSPSVGVGGSVGSAAGDYSTFAGIHKWLDGTFNATSVTVNWSTTNTGTSAPYAPGDIFSAVNDVNILLFRNGAVPDWVVGGPLAAVDVGKLFNDRIRLQQDETTRGFSAQYIRTTLANELRVLLDGYVSDTAGKGDIMILDSSRWRLRPYAGSLYYTITAPTLRDGDQVRALSKMSLEARNTGSDIGQASMLITNATL